MPRITDIVSNIEHKAISGVLGVYIKLTNNTGKEYRISPITQRSPGVPIFPPYGATIDFTYNDRPIPGLLEQIFDILEINSIVATAPQAQTASVSKRTRTTSSPIQASSSISQPPLLTQSTPLAAASAASFSASAVTIASKRQPIKPPSPIALAGAAATLPAQQASAASHQAIIASAQAAAHPRLTPIRPPSPVATSATASAAGSVFPQWELEEEDDTAFQRYNAFLSIIKKNTWLLDRSYQQEYNNLLRQVEIDPKKSLYFSYNPADENTISQFLQLFFINGVRSQQNVSSLNDYHNAKAKALGSGKCDVSCVSFLNITTHENRQATRKCLVSVSGSGHYHYPNLYDLLKTFIEQESANLTARCGGVKYYLVDHSGRNNGPEAFHRLIRDVLSIIGKPPAESFGKLCAEKGLVTTLTKLIVQYGIYHPVGNPNGIIVHSSFNVSFYPREIISGWYVAKNLPLASSIEITAPFGKIQIGNDYFPLYECCPESCVRNKDAVKFILAVAIQERAQLQGLLSPPRIVPSQ